MRRRGWGWTWRHRHATRTCRPCTGDEISVGDAIHPISSRGRVRECTARLSGPISCAYHKYHVSRYTRAASPFSINKRKASTSGSPSCCVGIHFGFRQFDKIADLFRPCQDTCNYSPHFPMENPQNHCRGYYRWLEGLQGWVRWLNDSPAMALIKIKNACNFTLNPPTDCGVNDLEGGVANAL